MTAYRTPARVTLDQSRRVTKADRRWWRVWCAVWRDIGDAVAHGRSRPRRARIPGVVLAAAMMGAAALPGGPVGGRTQRRMTSRGWR